MKQSLISILNFLGGKKTSISMIYGAVLVYLLGQGYIDSSLANLLAVIGVALGLTVNIGEPILRK